jgi:hypothetical protein
MQSKNIGSHIENAALNGVNKFVLGSDISPGLFAPSMTKPRLEQIHINGARIKFDI